MNGTKTYNLYCDENCNTFLVFNKFHKLFEIIQREVKLKPIKPIEDKTPEGEEIKKKN